MRSVNLLGVDVATDPRRTGLAVGRLEEGCLLVDHLAPRSTVEELVARYRDLDPPVLVCLDAPLGWPAAVGAHLADHVAGQALPVTRDVLFWRETDRVVRRVTGKRPLSVAADLLAHTAHQALTLVAALRLVRPTPVLLGPGSLETAGAIEVYPGAALAGLGVSTRGYKAAKGREPRARLLEALEPTGLRLTPDQRDIAVASADALDAALCLTIGVAFLQRRCVDWRDHEVDPRLVRKEGWMWVPTPLSSPPQLG